MTAGSDEADTLRRVAARCSELAGDADRTLRPDTWLFARLVAARDVRGELAWLGLSPPQLAGVCTRHFAVGLSGSPTPVAVLDGHHAAFVGAMRDLLLGFVAPGVDRDDARCLATIITHACLRPDHLWRDLGLSGRDDVTWMLERYFPELVARNVENLRWKKFLARELALSTGATPQPAPGCPGCEDFGFCFPDGR